MPSKKAWIAYTSLPDSHELALCKPGLLTASVGQRRRRGPDLQVITVNLDVHFAICMYICRLNEQSRDQRCGGAVCVPKSNVTYLVFSSSAVLCVGDMLYNGDAHLV